MNILIVIVVLFVLFIFFFGGEKGLRNAMMGSYNGIKNSSPGLPESFYLKEALRVRFMSWTDYKLEDFVSDCDNIDDLIVKIKFYEENGLI